MDDITKDIKTEASHSVAGMRQSAEAAEQQKIREAKEMQAAKEMVAAEALLKANDGGDHWSLADALLDAVPMKSSHDAGNLFDKIAETAKAKANVPFRGWSRNTMRQYRDTANAWKPDDRITGVSFSSHKEAISLADKERVLRELAKTNGATVANIKRLNRAANGTVTTSQGKEAEAEDPIQKLFDGLSEAKTDTVRSWLRKSDDLVLASSIQKWQKSVGVLTTELEREKTRRAAEEVKAKHKTEAAAKTKEQAAKAKANVQQRKTEAAIKTEAATKPTVAKPIVNDDDGIGDLRGL